MLKFKCWLLLKIFFAANITLVSSQVYADGYLTPTDLKKINYQCYLEETKIVFCSNDKIDDPQVIIKIPLLKPVILESGVRAYRVMATIDNYTKRNLVGARIFLTFGKEKNQSIDVMISEKIIYKATSSTMRSHLVRSDVPHNLSLYKALDEIYFKAEPSKIKIQLKELLFEESQ